MKTAAEIAVRLEAAEARLARYSASISNDPAIARVNGALLRKLSDRNDVVLSRYTEQSAVVNELRGQLARAKAREAEAERTRLTVEDVKDARLVRDEFGWHKVVRVSTKSVTVETGYSWTDRIAIDKILEVK